MSDKKLMIRGYAKVNLGLDVLKKREDGYHEVKMIMQNIDLYDEITLTAQGEPGTIELKLDGRCGDLEANEKNLAYRAAKRMFEEAREAGRQIPTGVSINLTKNIPMAAGLAGGSADCAAVLAGVNRLFAFDFPGEQMMRIGKSLGADVPYCLLGGTALAEGIGEKLTVLPAAPESLCLIAKPPVDVSTAFVYGNLKASELAFHPDIDGQIRALEEGDLATLAAKMGNVLETVTEPAYPVIAGIKETMKACGAINAMMSGSGPTVFGLFAAKEEMEKAAGLLRQMDPDMRVVETGLCSGKGE